MTDRGTRESVLTVLCAALPLLGELQPLVRQLFVAPLAFLVPAVRELSVLDRVRAGLFRPRLTPDRTIVGCGQIHRHGDLHLPPMERTLVRSLRSRRDCHHKNALFTASMGCPIREQTCLRNDRGGGVRLYGSRHAFPRPKRFGQRLNHGVIPSGRLLNPALETFLRRHPAPKTSFCPRLCDASRRRTVAHTRTL